MNDLKIGKKIIGENEPTFIIAEAGVNHNGSIEIAKKLIDNAKDAGADAVKFQTYKTENLVSKSFKDFYRLLKKLELTKEEFSELAEYAKEKDIIFFSTATDEEGIDTLLRLKVPVFKIASGDLTNLPFIEYCAQKKLPLIVSTGMSNLCEVEEAINTIYGQNNFEVALMHCVSSYPAPIKETNLNVINTLNNAFNVPIGFSDHSMSLLMPIFAASMGAKIIEKHFTLNKNLDGPDHKSSVDMQELKFIIKGIREMEDAKGSPTKKPSSSELINIKKLRKSITTIEYIKKGDMITIEKVRPMRPSDGIHPKYLSLILGKTAKKNLNPNESIKWEHLCE